MKPWSRRLISLWAALMIGASIAVAEEPTRIQVDLPSVSTSASTVPPGAFQIEGGVEYSRSRASGGQDEQQLLLGALLRVGLTDRLEARLNVVPVVWLWGDERETGVGDITLGVKYRFLDAREDGWWPSLGIMPVVKVPVARSPIGSERVDFGVVALASAQLTSTLSLDANVGLAALGQSKPDGFLLQGAASAALTRELGERWSVYVEAFYASPEERDGRHLVGVDAGIQFYVTPRVVLAAAATTSLIGPDPDYGFRGGLAIRFGR